MVTKTITVTEDAYNAIKWLKQENESFSELLKRLSKKPVTSDDLFGILNDTPKEAETFARRVQEWRVRANKDAERRMTDVRARLKRHH